MSRDNLGRFKKGMKNPNKGKTSRINVCAYCGKEFIRKTLIKSGVHKGKYTYSKVKYCDEHKHLSRFNSKTASMAGKKSQENGTYDKTLKKWRKNGREVWNKGISQTEEVKKKISKSRKGKTAWNKGLIAKIDDRIPSKERNGNWNGGITSENRKQRIKFRKTIQNKVLERDNYTCQICGKRGCKLQVDHIQPWSEFIEGRFDIDNCRTLCMDCHYFITFNKPKPRGVIWGHNLKNISKEVNRN
jgi:5-methylcytosine-specific restriction endonuclease McrA